MLYYSRSLRYAKSIDLFANLIPRPLSDCRHSSDNLFQSPITRSIHNSKFPARKSNLIVKLSSSSTSLAMPRPPSAGSCIIRMSPNACIWSIKSYFPEFNSFKPILTSSEVSSLFITRSKPILQESATNYRLLMRMGI